MAEAQEIDPILEYLLEFNQTFAIEYGRFKIPAGGLAKMLEDFKGFHLNTEVVVKYDIGLTPAPEVTEETTLEELYDLI